ncbi:MAG: NAD(P)-dependent oxidoreductase, partial [Saccharolobus sp.]
MSLGNYLILRVGALFSVKYKGLLYPLIRVYALGKTLKCNKNFYISVINIFTLGKVIKIVIKKDARLFSPW